MYEQKFAVAKHELYECGLCPNPYPYMCEECNMDVQDNVMEITAKDWNIPNVRNEDRLFIGSGDEMMWEQQSFGDCSCGCEQCSLGE